MTNLECAELNPDVQKEKLCSLKVGKETADLFFYSSDIFGLEVSTFNSMQPKHYARAISILQAANGKVDTIIPVTATNGTRWGIQNHRAIFIGEFDEKKVREAAKIKVNDTVLVDLETKINSIDGKPLGVLKRYSDTGIFVFSTNKPKISLTGRGPEVDISVVSQLTHHMRSADLHISSIFSLYEGAKSDSFLIFASKQ